MTPSKEWLELYEQKKDVLCCDIDLDDYFTEKRVGKAALDTFEIGTVNLPSGVVAACDPLIQLEDVPPFFQTVPPGEYPVTICVFLTGGYGDRYACAKVTVSERRPVRYEMGLYGSEILDKEFEEGDYFGFPVDAGMACIMDVKAQEAFKDYWAKRLEEDDDIDPYHDLFEGVLEQSAAANPKYQRNAGDWANWTVPGTDLNIPIFASGWGDGSYPTYFGYDAEDNVCGIYIQFIDVAEDAEDLAS